MGKKLSKQKDLKKVLWFFIKLNLFLIPFYAVIYFDLKYEPAQIAFATLVSFFISLIGFKVIQDGFILYLGNNNFPIDISFDCIGWKSSYSLIALVAASPGSIKKKLIFLLKWIPMMLLLNFLRVLIAIIVGFLFGFNYIMPLHDYFLQPLMIFVVLFIWMIYINSEEKIYRSKK
ncbi:MAG: archaeosortase/exosortase family protein [Candidatus Aenigmarchaeota archaeon]|nr:archaeosortase/exosortase family protein [Candidatus Aenigmarchaeota archaeon]